MTPKLITLKDLGFDLVLAKAKVTDPKLRYRRQVERYSSRGVISSIGRTILDRLQVQLGLSAQVAKEIETEVLRPYQDRLDNIRLYQDEFAKAVKHEYPLSSYVLSELENLLDVLGLRREDVDAIEQEVISQTAQSSEAAREEYQQKLQRYEKDFRRAVEAEYPLNSHVRNGLNDFQQSLGLRAEDVDQIERPILAQKYQQNLETEHLRQKQEQAKLKQEREKLEYQSNLQRYEQEFRRAIDAEYPLGNYAIDALRNFKNSLVLKDEDIRRIETPISQAKEAEYQKQQAAKLRQQQESRRLEQQDAEQLKEQQRRQKEESNRQQAELRQQQEVLQLREQGKQQNGLEKRHQDKKKNNKLPIFLGVCGIAIIGISVSYWTKMNTLLTLRCTCQLPNGCNYPYKTPNGVSAPTTPQGKGQIIEYKQSENYLTEAATNLRNKLEKIEGFECTTTTQ
jgi:hypothetical protein